MDKVFEKYDKDQYSKNKQDKKSCDHLLKHLKYLTKHPITHNTYISNIGSVSGTAFWCYRSYYCASDEFYNFILSNNESNSVIKFEMPKTKYVKYIRPIIDVKDKTILYKFGFA